MFDKLEYWKRRKEGLSGQGDKIKPKRNDDLSKPITSPKRLYPRFTTKLYCKKGYRKGHKIGK